MGTANSKESLDAVNAAIKARTPKGQRAAMVAELEQRLDGIKGDLLAVTRALSALGASLKAAGTLAKPAANAKSNIPFNDRSPAHKAAWERFHKEK